MRESGRAVQVLICPREKEVPIVLGKEKASRRGEDTWRPLDAAANANQRMPTRQEFANGVIAPPLGSTTRNPRQ